MALLWSKARRKKTCLYSDRWVGNIIPGHRLRTRQFVNWSQNDVLSSTLADLALDDENTGTCDVRCGNMKYSHDGTATSSYLKIYRLIKEFIIWRWNNFFLCTLLGSIISFKREATVVVCCIILKATYKFELFLFQITIFPDKDGSENSDSFSKHHSHHYSGLPDRI